jgi:8-oxo-dGTP diphosphatase
MPQVKVGVGVVIVRDNKVLLGQRQGSHGAGTWSCPGGHIEFGESVAECSARETLEETNTKLTLISPFFDWNEKIWEKEQKHYITIYSIGTIEGEPVVCEPDKCKEWRWFAAEELDDLILMEDAKMKTVLLRAIQQGS